MRDPRRAALAALFALAAGGGNAQTPPTSIPLSAGTALERAFVPGDTQVFDADLAAGRSYLLAVEQRGIHLVVDVRGPDGESLAAVDSPLDRWGTEIVLLRPAATGAYRIEVRAEKKGVGPGRCEIRLDETPESTVSGQAGIAALAAMTQASTILRREPTGSLDKILAAFQEARGHFQAAGDRPGEAEAIAALAEVAHRLGKRSQAVELFREAVSRWQELKRPEREMMAWNDLGLTLWEMSDLPAADEALARGLDLARRLGLAYHEADLRHNQCLVLHARGGVQPALACYREAAALFHQLGERKDEAAALNNLGFAWVSLGEPQPAEESYRQALAIRRAIGDRSGEAQALNNLAVLFRSLGEIDETLRAYGEAREILATLDDRRLEATTLNNLGATYSAIGETERARLYLTQALELRRAVEDRRGETVTLNNLGLLERRNGEAGKAVSYYSQALEAAQATSNARSEGIIRSNLGEAQAAAGRVAEALAGFDQALALHRRTGDRSNEAVTLRRKGETLAAGGQAAEALPLFEQALLALRAVGDRGELGDLESAASDAEAAISALESLRARLGNPELRAAFLGSRSDVYELRVDVLMRLAATHPGQGFDRAAFEASEHARARSLLDVLRESGAAVRAGLDPALAARQRDLERRLALKADRRQTLLARGRQEAQEIAALAPPGAVTTRLDFAADRDLVLSGGLRDFRYIHFATHGVFDTERPDLSGLALSRIDPAGNPREGFLRLRDVYGLDLTADLVVLSGCQTALGKEIRGEGLLGLTRGFLYAGAPRVVASLWWIDDRVTAALMSAFYRGLWAEGGSALVRTGPAQIFWNKPRRRLTTKTCRPQ